MTQKQSIDLSFRVEEGAIHVNQVQVGHMTADSMILWVDCAQKYPGFSALFDDQDGELSIILHVEKGDEYDSPTLHVTASPDEDGHYERTWITVSGFEGDWHMFEEWGKWGPNIALLRKMPRCEEWPAYHEQPPNAESERK